MERQLLTALVCVFASVSFTSADTIRGIDLSFVNIGHASNAADSGGTPGCGAVGYNYRIGKYAVTNAQWNAFTTAAGVPTGSDGGYGRSTQWVDDQQPTNQVSWYEAAQFCNWLTSGNKSKGVYLFSGNNSNPGNFLGINRVLAQTTYGTIYVLPTEDEWYKAAYFKPDGSSYSLYANGTNMAPVTGVNSNYGDLYGSPWNVGSGTMEQNGTYDMMGNVWEWNETAYSGSVRGIRGGAVMNSSSYYLSSAIRLSSPPNYEGGDTGFRIASIPEPTTMLLLGLGGMILRSRK